MLPRAPLNSSVLGSLIGVFLVIVGSLYLEKLGGDPGLGWHLKTGELIATTGSVPMNDPFLAGFESKRWICNQWLGDLILYYTHQIGSWGGIHLLALLVGYVTFFGMLFSSQERGGVYDSRIPALPQNLAITLAALCGAVHWITRPVVFSLLGFALTLQLIRLHRAGTIRTITFVVLTSAWFAVWANLHPGFVLGLLLLALHAVFIKETPRSRSAAILAFLCAGIATLLNPNGIELHLGALQLGSSAYFMNLNTEWLPPNIANPIFAPFFLAVLLVVLAGVIRNKTSHYNISAFDCCIAILFLLCAFKAARFVPFFGIAALPLLIQSIHCILERLKIYHYINTPESPTTPSRRWIALALVLGLSITALRESEPALTIDHHFSKAAIDAAFNSNLTPNPGKVLHSPNFGGAVIWSTFPRRAAYIDDRNELNGEQRYKDFLEMQNLGKNWRALFDKEQFERAMLYTKSPLSALLAINPEWRELFRDEDVVVFERISEISDIQN